MGTGLRLVISRSHIKNYSPSVSLSHQRTAKANRTLEAEEEQGSMSQIRETRTGSKRTGSDAGRLSKCDCASRSWKPAIASARRDRRRNDAGNGVGGIRRAGMLMIHSGMQHGLLKQAW